MSTLHYQRQGTGEPLVLIHGIGHQGRAWDPLPTMLAGSFDVITVDLAGHGRSPGPREGQSYEISSHCEQLEELFQELDLGRPHLVGNSLGGHIALELGLRGSARSVTALAPAGFYTWLGWAWAGIVLFVMKALSYTPVSLLRRGAVDARMRRASMGLLYVHGDRLTPDALVADTLNLRRSPGFWGQVLHDGRFRHSHGARHDVPTTIAWGTKDLVLLPTQARRARRLVPDVNHVLLPGCGHCPMLDEPELVAKVITDTVARAKESAVA